MYQNSEASPVTLYTIVHLCFGFLATYALKLRLWVAISLHLFFELFENTSWGIRFFRASNKQWKFLMPLFEKVGLQWKEYGGDSVLNSAVDNISFTIGAVFGKYIRTKKLV